MSEILCGGKSAKQQMKKGQTKEGIEGSELLLSMSTGLEDSTNLV